MTSDEKLDLPDWLWESLGQAPESLARDERPERGIGPPARRAGRRGRPDGPFMGRGRRPVPSALAVKYSIGLLYEACGSALRGEARSD